MDSVNMERQMPGNATQMGTGTKKGISGSTVKMIAVIAMLIDHAAAVVLARILVSGGMTGILASGNEQGMLRCVMDNAALLPIYTVMRSIGRLGFPIFCFLLVEGYQRTRSAGRYALRLGIFALISEVPFDLAISSQPFEPGYQNVFFTLLLALAALCVYDFVKKHVIKVFPVVARMILAVAATALPASYGVLFLEKYYGVENTTAQGVLFVVFVLGGAFGWAAYGKKQGMIRLQEAAADAAALVLIMYLADLLQTDYSGMGVLTVTAMYLFRRKKVISMTAGCVVLTIMSMGEAVAFAALIPVALYNGSRGWKMKYFFYAFYPVHLFLLYLAAVALGLGGVRAF